MEAVDFDRLDAEMERLGDLTGPFALPYQLKNLKLTVGELFNGRSDHFRPAAGKDLQDFSRHFFTDVNLAAQDSADGLHHLAAAFLFHDVAAAACSQDAF